MGRACKSVVVASERNVAHETDVGKKLGAKRWPNKSKIELAQRVWGSWTYEQRLIVTCIQELMSSACDALVTRLFWLKIRLDSGISEFRDQAIMELDHLSMCRFGLNRLIMDHSETGVGGTTILHDGVKDEDFITSIIPYAAKTYQEYFDAKRLSNIESDDAAFGTDLIGRVDQGILDEWQIASQRYHTLVLASIILFAELPNCAIGEYKTRMINNVPFMKMRLMGKGTKRPRKPKKITESNLPLEVLSDNPERAGNEKENAISELDQFKLLMIQKYRADHSQPSSTAPTISMPPPMSESTTEIISFSEILKIQDSDEDGKAEMSTAENTEIDGTMTPKSSGDGSVFSLPSIITQTDMLEDLDDLSATKRLQTQLGANHADYPTWDIERICVRNTFIDLDEDNETKPLFTGKRRSCSLPVKLRN